MICMLCRPLPPLRGRRIANSAVKLSGRKNSSFALQSVMGLICLLNVVTFAWSTSKSDSFHGKKFAVLIDAENVNDQRDVPRVLREVGKMGDAIIKNAYADWTRLPRSWAKVIQDHGMSPVHVFSHPKKCSSDVKMIVDGMDLLRIDDISSIAIVSCDADFTAFARRAQETGKDVMGFGYRSRTSRALVGACSLFTYIENLPLGLDNDAAEIGEAVNVRHESAHGEVPSPEASESAGHQSGTHKPDEFHLKLEEAWATTRKQCGWSDVGEINAHLLQIGINCTKIYAGKKFSQVLKESNLFEMDFGVQTKLAAGCRLKSWSEWFERERTAVRQHLVEAWEDVRDEESGAANLGNVKDLLLRRHRDFDPRTFGFSRISEMISGMFPGEWHFEKSGTAMMVCFVGKQDRGAAASVQSSTLTV